MTLIDITGTIHRVKCWPDHFEAILDGRKAFDVRRDDRGYGVGDVLELHEWTPDRGAYTGRVERAVITYIYRGEERDPVPVYAGTVVLGLSVGGIEI